MARIVEFYIPSRFMPQEKWMPEEERGRIIVFPLDLKKSALTSYVSIYERILDSVYSLMLPWAQGATSVTRRLQRAAVEYQYPPQEDPAMKVSEYLAVHGSNRVAEP